MQTSMSSDRFFFRHTSTYYALVCASMPEKSDVRHPWTEEQTVLVSSRFFDSLANGINEIKIFNLFV